MAALRQWIDLFVDFLVTKHGLADTVQPGSSGYASLHTSFIDRLMPVAGQLLDAAVAAGEIRPAIEPYELMRVGAAAGGAGSVGSGRRVRKRTPRPCGQTGASALHARSAARVRALHKRAVVRIVMPSRRRVRWWYV
ncbi:hypothetical protein [Streptomyces sp. H27-H1]|uniref:SbtR family transcriptional regulator n=1 Tax=Streptomyces sp. H27-H1 TaxID=2996461 RepID=UPI002D1E44A5|nr:hypothetical protein [Streptomyces sp. H27-H1]